MSLLVSGWPGGFSAQQVRCSHGTWVSPERAQKGRPIIPDTLSWTLTPLALACSFLQVLCQESSFALSLKMPKVSCVFWRCFRDLSPIPAFFLPLGVHSTLLGADATRLPVQCHGCLPGCWSQAGFGYWEGMVWARSSLLGATRLLPHLTYPGDYRHQWPNWSKPKHLDLFILG